MTTRLFSNFKTLPLIVLAALAVGSSSQALAQTADRKLGEVVINTVLKNTAITVSATTPELNALARTAFGAHGAFRLQPQGFVFDVKFAPAATNQVQVTISKGGAVVLNQVVSGSSSRNALLRAADAAVRAMTGKPGFFASRLAFIGERTGKPEVYVGDLFLGEVRQITNDRALALNPEWSPDGGRLLYTSFFRTGFPDIFSLDLNNLQRSTFVSLKGTNSGARFSPDGRSVAMVLSGEGNPEIYVGNAQGRQITRKTRTQAVEASPCFSPDNSQIVFTSDSMGAPQLFVMPAAGGQARRLVTQLSRYCAEPDWSKADPRKLAFTLRIGSGYQIGVYDFSTGTAKVVSKVASDAVEPTWLADGRHLVFTARSANQRALWILDTENGKATALSNASAGMLSQASVLDPR
jgi:TolB protein